MFGTFKFLLAIIIILSHNNIFITLPGAPWFHEGVTAVIGFFFVSGYLTKLSLIRKYQLNQKKVISFYRDRLIRILPQYYFYSILTFLFLACTGFIAMHYSLSAILSNLLVIPLNLHKFFNVSFFANSDYALIPPAWYLGTELQFYLLAPFLFKYRKSEIAMFFISLGVIFACLLWSN